MTACQTHIPTSAKKDVRAAFATSRSREMSRNVAKLSPNLAKCHEMSQNNAFGDFS
jgi:hypothetical protein